jgi:hypothetical protein
MTADWQMMPDLDRMKEFVQEAFDNLKSTAETPPKRRLTYWHARFSTTGRITGRSMETCDARGRFWSQTVPWLGVGNRAHDAIAGGKGEVFHRNLASSA